MSQPFVRHVSSEPAVNWSENLEELHEESSRTHFIDVWTRRAILARIGGLPEDPTIVDLGCSSGYLLEDIQGAIPDARLALFDGGHAFFLQDAAAWPAVTEFLAGAASA